MGDDAISAGPGPETCSEGVILWERGNDNKSIKVRELELWLSRFT